MPKSDERRLADSFLSNAKKKAGEEGFEMLGPLLREGLVCRQIVLALLGQVGINPGKLEELMKSARLALSSLEEQGR